MMRKASLLMSAALLMLTACSEDAQPAAGISTARARMQPLVDSACDWMFGCCSADELVYQVGGFTVDADDCSARLTDAIVAGVPLEFEQMGLSNGPAEGLLVLALSINEGRVDVDTAAVQECSEATRTRDCNVGALVDPNPTGRCTPNAAQVEADPCDPNEMFRGRQEAGEECDGPWECRSGLRCADFGIAGVCAELADEGDSCFSDEECGDGLVCSYEEGVCTEGATAGQACQYADPLNPIPGTETIRCADGLNCDPSAQVCTGGFCAPGSPCEDTSGDSDCPDSFFCVGNLFTAATCQLPGAEGAPCTKAADCATGYCNPGEGTCGPLLLTGNPCLDDVECQSGFCSMGLCNPSLGPGMPCATGDSRECQRGYCDTTDFTMPVCQAYAGMGAPCPLGIECDPSLSLLCQDATCLMLPFPNGTSCVDNSQCASQACFMGECATGAVIGAPCRTDGTTEPCILGSFCETAAGAVDGTCAGLRRSGESCDSSGQCWGECIVRFGRQMCDATPALSLGEAWCDGP